MKLKKVIIIKDKKENCFVIGKKDKLIKAMLVKKDDKIILKVYMKSLLEQPYCYDLSSVYNDEVEIWF